MSTYNYTKTINLNQLSNEIAISTIVTALSSISALGDSVTIVFKASLSVEDKTTLDSIVNSHVAGQDEDVPLTVQIDQPSDVDERILVRPVAARSGWTYSLFPIEFTTAKLNSLYSKKSDGTDHNGVSVKFYNSSDELVTDAQYENTIVKTVIDFEPEYDYEVIGGAIQQKSIPSTDIRVWVVGVPDVPEANGGSKEMVCGVNLKFIDPTDKISADGRVSKYMSYNSTYHTNKLRFIIKHDAGVQHDLLSVLEFFKQ